MYIANVFSYEAYQWPIFLCLHRDHNNVNVCAYTVDIYTASYMNKVTLKNSKVNCVWVTRFESSKFIRAISTLNMAYITINSNLTNTPSFTCFYSKFADLSMLASAWKTSRRVRFFTV